MLLDPIGFLAAIGLLSSLLIMCIGYFTFSLLFFPSTTMDSLKKIWNRALERAEEIELDSEAVHENPKNNQ